MLSCRLIGRSLPQLSRRLKIQSRAPMLTQLTGEGEVEVSVGITAYANSAPGFQGILKQRFADFVVREVSLEGEVLQVSDTDWAAAEAKFFPAPEAPTITASVSGSSTGPTNVDLVEAVITDLQTTLNSSLYSDAGGCTDATLPDSTLTLRQFLLLCSERSPECPKSFTTFPCADKATRGTFHGIVRKYFSAFSDTDTVVVNEVQHLRFLPKTKATRGGQFRSSATFRARDWPAGLPDFLRFTAIKENVDTMSAAGIIARQLKINQDDIRYAGTKDKRAVTVQHFTLYRKKPGDVQKLNRFNFPPIVKVGNYRYVPAPLQLGELKGNRFTIALRALTQSNDVVREACEQLKTSGFINYFGLQRFGKGGTKSHLIGRSLVKGEWKNVVDMLFVQREGDRDEIRLLKEAYRAGKIKHAFQICPPQMQGERLVLEFLSRHPTDYLGAYNRMAKNTRVLCAHAYQSYIWNVAASERVKRFGLACVEGDLVALDDAVLESSLDEEEVAVEGASAAGGGGGAEETVEVVGKASVGNAFQRSDENTNRGIYKVTAADVESGRFSVRDVILPLPGSDIILPANSIAEVYESLLAADGLSLASFSNCPTTYRSRGCYRRLMQFPEDLQWSVVNYESPNSDIVETELMQLVASSRHAHGDSQRAATSLPGVPIASMSSPAGSGDLRALVVQFTLPAGTYATILLRELTKESTESQYQAQLTASQVIDGTSTGSGSGSGSGSSSASGDGPEALEDTNSPKKQRSDA